MKKSKKCKRSYFRESLCKKCFFFAGKKIVLEEVIIELERILFETMMNETKTGRYTFKNKDIGYKISKAKATRCKVFNKRSKNKYGIRYSFDI